MSFEEFKDWCEYTAYVPWWLVAFALVVICAVIMLMAAYVLNIGRPLESCPGKVIGKNFTPDTQETHAVPVATGNGLGVGISSSGHAREYITIIELDEGGVFEFNSLEVWAKAKIGQGVRADMRRGWSGGWNIEALDWRGGTP